MRLDFPRHSQNIQLIYQNYIQTGTVTCLYSTVELGIGVKIAVILTKSLKICNLYIILVYKIYLYTVKYINLSYLSLRLFFG